jgi:hypothetical protein
MIKGWTIAIAAVFFAAACTSEEGISPEPAREGITIRQHDSAVFDATVRSGGATLHVLIQQVEPDVLDVSYDFGDPVIGFRLDYREGAGEFQPSGAPLDAAQMRLIEMLLADLEALPSMKDEQRPRIDEVAYRATNLMTIVPTGESLSSHTFVAQQGWTHISCSCFNQYLGAGYYRICGKGSGCTGGSGNGCKGRCGAGCWPCAGTTAYTRDCGRHDWGIGSWAAASDDFTFASNNCSC